MKTLYPRTALTALALATAIITAPGQLQPQPGQQPPDSVVAVVADALGLPFVPPDQRPFFGTFWEVRSSLPCLTAPMPCPPSDPNTAVYAIADPSAGGHFLVDGTAGQVLSPQTQYTRRTLRTSDSASILQAQLDELQNFVAQIQASQAAAQLRANGRMSSLDLPPVPGGGGGTNSEQGSITNNAYVCTTNDLWLEITTMTNSTGVFVVHPPSAEVTAGVYDLFMTTNLGLNVPGLNLTNWLWLLRTEPGETNLTVPNLNADTAFFMLARTNDSDGDLLSDAYEHLVSHTDPDTPDALIITTQPLSQEVVDGDTVTFSVVAWSGEAMTYQWTFNGTNIAGGTTSSYTVNGVQTSDAGAYAVIVSNRFASVSSQDAQLTVGVGSGDSRLMFLKGTRDSYTFKPGVTYYIASSTVELHGTTKLMGGSVVKFASYAGSSLVVKGSLICDTQPYYPAILTSADDDSQGQWLWWWSSGYPQPVANGAPYLDLTLAQSNSIHDLRICFADIGITIPASSGRLDVWDCQFVQCTTAITNAVCDSGAVASLHNVLFAQCGTAIAATTNSTEIQGEHVTADVNAFLTAQSPAYKIALTNSIILGALGDASTVITQNVSLNPPATVFQKAGYGNYYLAPGSPCQGAGTTNISARLSSELQHKTTCPPMALPAFMQLSGEMTLLPQARRYTGAAPDIGFWYDALDYSVGNVTVAGGKVTVEPGTAIAVRNEYLPASDSWTSVGFYVKQGSAFISHGTPTRPNIFTAEKMVQETPEADFAALQVMINDLAGFWYAGIVSFIPDYEPVDDTTPAPILDFRFSQFFLPSADYHLWSGLNEFPLIGGANIETSLDSAMYLTLQDCSVYGGRINLGNPDDISLPWDQVYAPGSVTWANTLFDRVAIYLDPTYYRFGYGMNVDLTFHAYNNLFKEGLWFFIEQIPASAGNWKFTDNLFDKVDFIQNTNLPLDLSYNTYWAKQPSELFWPPIDMVRLLPTVTGSGQNERVLAAAPPYQPGPLGNYYLPTNTPLYHAGSRTANDAGLFHYTTRVDQVKEGEEYSGHMVNIGLHYVAATNGLPKDTDGDGIPDYVENASGTGAVGADETDWQTQYTMSGVFDPTNSVYDDIDLSGDGLVGRIKKALGMQPFDMGNPLTLSQVLTGEEPDFATFEVPLGYDAVTGSGALNLNMNGVPVTLAECTRATNGNCLLSFNVAFDPAGLHYLSAAFRLGTEPGTPHPVTTAAGVVQPLYSSNSVQFYENASMFDATGAFLDAKLFAQQADYTIDLYDLSTTPRTPILSITNSTSNGIIQEDWAVTNADGTPFTGTTIAAVFSVTPSGYAAALPSKPTKILTCAAGSLSECGSNFDVAYLYTPTNNSLGTAFSKGGAIWIGMQSMVDALISEAGGYAVYRSSFNRYMPDPHGEYPGYLTSRADVTNNLLPDLTNGLTRQFYCYAHGNGNRLANYAGDVCLDAGEVGRALGNTYTKTNLITQKPYRFVFLDGCATASSMDWSRAFGIYPLNEAPRDKVGAQAYVGWATDHMGWMNGSDGSASSLAAAKAYTQTLQTFYADWMFGKSLKQCIDNASFLALSGRAQFPVPDNSNVLIYANGYSYLYTNIDTSKIVVVGHSGLAKDRVYQNLDGYYPMPTK